MRSLLRLGLTAFFLTQVAIAQDASWRTGLRIIPWVADGHVEADFSGDRYQTTVIVSLTSSSPEHPETTCTVEAQGVELIGPSGKRSSSHTFELSHSSGPRVWSARTPSDGPLATGHVVVDCTIEAGEVPGLFGSRFFSWQEIEAYSTFSLFTPDSKLKTEATVFSSDCRFWSSQLFVDTADGARMALAVANHREEPETLKWTVYSQGDGEIKRWSMPLPGMTAKAFFLDEILDDVPEGILLLFLSAESRRPLGAIGLRYTDGTFSTVPFWPIDLSPRGQPCGDGPYGRDPVDE